MSHGGGCCRQPVDNRSYCQRLVPIRVVLTPSSVLTLKLKSIDTSHKSDLVTTCARLLLSIRYPPIRLLRLTDGTKHRLVGAIVSAPLACAVSTLYWEQSVASNARMTTSAKSTPHVPMPSFHTKPHRSTATTRCRRPYSDLRSLNMQNSSCLASSKRLFAFATSGPAFCAVIDATSAYQWLTGLSISRFLESGVFFVG
jgi:hypothetical protein